jgi:hypothetical protein
MSSYALIDEQLLVGALDLTAFATDFDQWSEADMLPATTMSSLGYPVVLPGLSKCGGSIKVVAGFAATDASTLLNGYTGTQVAYSSIPQSGTATAGAPASTMRGRISKLDRASGAINTVAAGSLDFVGDSAQFDGYLGCTLALRGALTGTSIQMGAIPSGSRLWAALHVISGTFTSLAVTIESDNATGFPSAATALTFSTVSAAGWQFLSAAGPMTDDWFRVKATIGSGTAQYCVVVGID